MEKKICVTSLLKFPEKNQVVRVVDTDHVYALVCVIHEKKERYSPLERHLLVDLAKDIKHGLIHEIEGDPYRPEPVFLDDREGMSNAQHKKEEKYDQRRDRAYEVVSWVLAQAGTDIADPSIWRAVTQEAADKFGISHPQIVRRWVNVFWRNGMIPNALRPAYVANGTTIRSDTSEKVGAVGHPLKRGCKITSIIRRRMRQFVKKRRGKRLTVKQLHLRYLSRYHRAGIDGFNKHGKPKVVYQKPSLCPSLAIFTYYFHRDRDYIEDKIAALGEKKYAKDYSPAIHSTKAPVFGPLTRVELDFTIGSNLLVSSFRRTQIIGKPLVGIAYDVYSSAILGLLVTWERASEMQMRLLLENVMSRKVPFCAKYGELIEEKDWPFHFIPFHLVFDRGSESNFSIGDDMVSEFNFYWENLATASPQKKPSVEANFAKMERFSKSRAGWEPQFWKRGDPLPESSAEMTIEEYTRLLIKDIILHNNTTLASRYIDPAALKAGLSAPSPIELFKFGVKRGGKLKEEKDPQTLRRRILPPENATIVKKRGIVYNGLDYEHPELDNFFAIARDEGVKNIKIVPNPDVVDSISFRPDPKQKRHWLTCTLTNFWDMYKGLSHVEVQKLREEDAEIRARNFRRNRDANLKHLEETEDVEGKAAKETLDDRLEAGLGAKGFEGGDRRKLRKEEIQSQKENPLAEGDTPAAEPDNVIRVFPPHQNDDGGGANSSGASERDENDADSVPPPPADSPEPEATPKPNLYARFQRLKK